MYKDWTPLKWFPFIYFLLLIKKNITLYSLSFVIKLRHLLNILFNFFFQKNRFFFVLVSQRSKNTTFFKNCNPKLFVFLNICFPFLYIYIYMVNGAWFKKRKMDRFWFKVWNKKKRTRKRDLKRKRVRDVIAQEKKLWILGGEYSWREKKKLKRKRINKCHK